MIYIAQFIGKNVGKIGYSKHPIERIQSIARELELGEIHYGKTYLYDLPNEIEAYLLDETEKHKIYDSMTVPGYTERRTQQGIDKAIHLLGNEQKIPFKSYLEEKQKHVQGVAPTNKINNYLRELAKWKRKELNKKARRRPATFQVAYKSNMLKQNQLFKSRAELRRLKAIRITFYMALHIVKIATEACENINSMSNKKFYVIDDYASKWRWYIQRLQTSRFTGITPFPIRVEGEKRYKKPALDKGRHFDFFNNLHELNELVTYAQNIEEVYLSSSYWSGRLSLKFNLHLNDGATLEKVKKLITQVDSITRIVWIAYYYVINATHEEFITYSQYKDLMAKLTGGSKIFTFTKESRLFGEKNNFVF